MMEEKGANLGDVDEEEDVVAANVEDNSNNEERSRPSPRGCGRARGRGRGCHPKSNQRRYDKTNMKCYNCHELCHYAWERRTTSNNIEEKVNLVNSNQEVEESTLLLMIKEKENEDNNMWYLDNDASNHMYCKSQSAT